MPRSGIPVGEMGNITSTQDRTQLLCKKNAHHKDCVNPRAATHPALVSAPAGCVSRSYWRARARVQLVAGERSVQVTGSGRTRSAAENRLRDLVKKRLAETQNARASARILLTPKSQPVSVILFERAYLDWFEAKERSGAVSAETLDRYELVYRSVLEDTLGSEPIHELTAPGLTTVLDEIPVLNENGDWERVSYVKHAGYIIRATLQRAVARHGWLEVNPMREVEIPKPPARAVRRAVRALRPDEYAALRRAIQAQPRHAPYLLPLIDFMAGTGVRVSEALAMRRENVIERDGSTVIILDKHIVPEVRGSSTYVLKDGLKETKRRTSDGKVLFDRRIINVVPDGVRVALRERLAAADPEPSALLFSTRNGTIIAPNNLRRTLKMLVTQLSLPGGVATHSFRKLAAEAIEAVMSDEGESASSYIGNSASVAQRHYLPIKVRETPAAMGAILDEMMRSAAPDRYDAAS